MAGMQNLNDIITLFEAEGRLPTAGGKTARERALGLWLQRRRQDASEGTLIPYYRDALSAVPGWAVPAPNGDTAAGGSVGCSN
jgi:hypothetical protein